MPAISIVVPALNVGATLDATLRSLQAQSFRDFEVLVVNNASEDDTLAVALRFGKTDGRFRSLDFAERRGMSGNFNRGLAAASGQWLMYLPGDDLVLPNGLETLMALGRRFPGVGLLIGQFDLANHDLSQRFPNQSGWARVRGAHRLDRRRAYRLFAEAPRGEACSSLVRRDWAVAEGGLPEHFERVNGWSLYGRIAARAGLAIHPEPVALYRMHDGQRAHRESVFVQQARERVKLLEEQLSMFQQLGLGALAAARLRRSVARGLLAIARDPRAGPELHVVTRDLAASLAVDGVGDRFFDGIESASARLRGAAKRLLSQ